MGFIRKNVDDFLEKNSLEPDFVRLKLNYASYTSSSDTVL